MSKHEALNRGEVASLAEMDDEQLAAFHARVKATMQEVASKWPVTIYEAMEVCKHIRDRRLTMIPAELAALEGVEEPLTIEEIDLVVELIANQKLRGLRSENYQGLIEALEAKAGQLKATSYQD